MTKIEETNEMIKAVRNATELWSVERQRKSLPEISALVDIAKSLAVITNELGCIHKELIAREMKK